jgi:predicted RNA-binding protein with PIN domain
MLKQIISIFLILTLSQGCTQWSLKRSANNKLVDFNGFEGGKRRPVYNKKYIERAKRNVQDYDLEDDYTEEDQELSTPISQNRAMYKSMISRDLRSKSLKGRRARYEDSMNDDVEDGYPDLEEAASITKKPATNQASGEMERELLEIKKMLSETKKDLAKYRCPMQQQTAKSPANPSSYTGTHSISDSIMK